MKIILHPKMESKSVRWIHDEWRYLDYSKRNPQSEANLKHTPEAAPVRSR